MADLQSAMIVRLRAHAGVSAIAGQRIYWSIAPQGAARPYLRLQTISDPRPQHLKDYDAARATRVQADAFADTYAAGRALAEAVITGMAAPAEAGGVRFGRTHAEGPRDLGEDTASGFIHRASVDLLVWHQLA